MTVFALCTKESHVYQAIQGFCGKYTCPRRTGYDVRWDGTHSSVIS